MSAAAPGWAYRQIVDLADARPGRVGNSEAVFDVFTRRRQRSSATWTAGVPTVAPPVGAWDDEVKRVSEAAEVLTDEQRSAIQSTAGGASL